MDNNPFVIARRKVKDFDTVFGLSPPNYEYTITWYIEWIITIYTRWHHHCTGTRMW